MLSGDLLAGWLRGCCCLGCHQINLISGLLMSAPGRDLNRQPGYYEVLGLAFISFQETLKIQAKVVPYQVLPALKQYFRLSTFNFQDTKMALTPSVVKVPTSLSPGRKFIIPIGYKNNGSASTPMRKKSLMLLALSLLDINSTCYGLNLMIQNPLLPILG
jgi:hypothetical protein